MQGPTRRPWEIGDPMTDIVTISGRDAGSNAYHWIAECPQREARLIAASPDLLAACKAAVRMASKWHGAPTPSERHVLQEVLRAAITKAEGES